MKILGWFVIHLYLFLDKEIENFLEANRKRIESEELLVFFLDECHLVWGDICGYIWGRTDMRIEIPVKNEKEKQTYYGAINYRTGQVITNS